MRTLSSRDINDVLIRNGIGLLAMIDAEQPGAILNIREGF